MAGSRRRSLRSIAIIATFMVGLGIISSPATADPGKPGSARSAESLAAEREAAIAKERFGRGDLDLPYLTRKLADGSIEKFVDPEAEAQILSITAASSGCGSACDGKDPASYLAPMPGGPSNYAYCSTDAYTKYSKTSSDGRLTAELRYSPYCRTAWTRGCCYNSMAGFSYYSNGNVRLSVYNYDGRFSGDDVWTAMLDDAGYTFKACYDGQIGGPSEWKCTAKW
ncbi:DUF2690 domain-containing protein [Micromonospora chalcea]|uniref:DUF2690 domain-containing protein n=1 Tax=Micromonospora chalcea TaxID=1874 RepID=UPI001656D62F|nr:DUF2690 domain-containing protein [Micromonospora chalcea]MBC8994252.1 DUF2690 domain-containing protein [Micromonospora chalcea]